uniref:S9 family peptidase n=1 Tax=Fulvivirga sp. TaxID=1931237 RepID=UPI00404B4A38
MIKRILILFLLFPFLTVAQTSSNIELLDVFNMEHVGDPVISPDGTKIIYTRNFNDIMADRNLSNLWMINFDGTNNRPITTGNQSDFQPKWSPDGKQIIYHSNKDGNVQIYLRWLDTGAESKLTNGQKSPGSIRWSRDGQYIAFTMFVPKEKSSPIKMPAKPSGAKWNDAPIYIDDMTYRADGAGYLPSGNRQIFVMSINGGMPRQLTDFEVNTSTPEWSADGSKLYFSTNNREDRDFEPNDSDIYELGIADLKLKQLTDRKGPDGNPAVSHDGKKIAYLGFEDEYLGYQMSQLYTMNADGSDKQLISKGFDRDIDNIAWAGDGASLYFQYDDQGNTRIANISLSGKVTQLVDGVGGLSMTRPYTGGAYSVSANGRYAYTYGKNGLPPNLAVGEKGSSKVITSLNAEFFKYKKASPIEEMWWESSFDKQKIQGWVVKPPNFDPAKKYPMILEIHGGPFAAYGPWFSTEVQLMAAAGYVVLYTNPRGSSSYGKDFGNLIHHNYPNQDYDDLMSGVDALISKGYVDSNQLFVTGGSGGGVLTAWIVGKTNRFKAAVVAKPVINWYSFVLYSDNPSFFYRYWMPGLPWDHLEHYMKRSPISLVGNVTTPTMLLTGESDYRTPIAESEQYYAALKLAKVESAMVRIPGAPHGIAGRPSNLIAKVQAILMWFEKYK